MQAMAYSSSAFNHALGTKSFGNMTDRYNMELAIEQSKPKNLVEMSLRIPYTLI